MKLAIKTCTLDMPYEQMLDFCVEQKIAAIEIGTGNWSGAPHCDLDLLVSDKTAREKWYDAMREKGLELCDQVHPDLLLGTDPDCDRCGTAVPDGKGGYRPITGNAMGIILLDYICRTRNALGTPPIRADRGPKQRPKAPASPAASSVPCASSCNPTSARWKRSTARSRTCARAWPPPTPPTSPRSATSKPRFPISNSRSMPLRKNGWKPPRSWGSSYRTSLNGTGRTGLLTSVSLAGDAAARSKPMKASMMPWASNARLRLPMLICLTMPASANRSMTVFAVGIDLPMARAMLAAVKIGRPAMASASAPSAGVRFPRASCRQAVPDEWFSARPLIRVPALLA